MSIYFDKRDKLWRIQVQKAGRRLSTTARSAKEARAMNEKMTRDLSTMHRRKTGILPQFFPDQVAEATWSKSIEEAAADKSSWLWRIRRNIAKRHTKRHQNGLAISVDDLKSLYVESCGRCAVSGLRLERPGCGKVTALTASVDRMNPDYGYIRPNCRIVAFCVNAAMNNWGEDLFKKVCYGVVAREFL